MAFVLTHVWVELDGRIFKVVFDPVDRPSYIMEWKKRGVFKRYWRSDPHSRKPWKGGRAERIIAAAEEIRGV